MQPSWPKKVPVANIEKLMQNLPEISPAPVITESAIIFWESPSKSISSKNTMDDHSHTTTPRAKLLNLNLSKSE